jgi:hypothetical protein
VSADPDRIDVDVCLHQPFFASPEAAAGRVAAHPGGQILPITNATYDRLQDLLGAGRYSSYRVPTGRRSWCGFREILKDKDNAVRVAWATIKLSEVGQRPVRVDQLAARVDLAVDETVRLLPLTCAGDLPDQRHNHHGGHRPGRRAAHRPA